MPLSHLEKIEAIRKEKKMFMIRLFGERGYIICDQRMAKKIFGYVHPNEFRHSSKAKAEKVAKQALKILFTS